MNLLDYIIIASLILSMLYSCWRGFIRDIFSILALLGGVLLALKFYYIGQSFLSTWIHNLYISRIGGFFIVFVVISLLIWISGRVLRRTIRAIHLSWIDRWAGLAFGLIKGIVIAGIFVMILWAFLPSKSKIFENSRLAPIILRMIKGVSPIFPEGIKSHVDKSEGTYIKG
jgi:membrane protein required for colicin V production